VGSSSTHKFPWKWTLEGLKDVPKNGLKVFSCFSCGGGSSMGYKLAGYDVVGNCEIDPRVNAVYKLNNHPRLSYEMDVRDFLAIEDLPEELFHLDILDGSPPCSVFSTAGKREEGWNTEKVFREGQARQRLDDLFFWFIKIAERLQPKVVVAENVKGLVIGNAKGYVNEIIKAFDEAGYDVQLFLLNAAMMGVPQARERCFFVAHRKDFKVPRLELRFNEDPILFGDVRTEHGMDKPVQPLDGKLLAKRRWTDRDICDINKRVRGKNVGFTKPILSDLKVAPTLTSGGTAYRMCDALELSIDDFRNCQTFPQDYDFSKEGAQYICGMSVPPVMMAQVSSAIYEQWFKEA
jgi:Site-specific DNA methylase